MSNNTVQSATKLGRVGIDGAKTRQVQGLLSQSNRVDIYQFSLVGRNRYRARFDFATDQGACKVALGLADTKGKVTFSTAPLRPGKALARELRPYREVNGEDVPPEGLQASRVYIKLFRPTQDVNYRFSIKYKELD
ncbi:MAG: hypothetical protein HC769_34715 [Cyanobacteria bacterium CRU_2_1]|nr:hypothetical protein [Cyanobacteria bacterium CRU_2_1]